MLEAPPPWTKPRNPKKWVTTFNSIILRGPRIELKEKLTPYINYTVHIIKVMEITSLHDAIWCLCVFNHKGIEKDVATLAYLFADSVRHLMKDARSRNALDTAKRFLNGVASVDELHAAHTAAVAASLDANTIKATATKAAIAAVAATAADTENAAYTTALAVAAVATAIVEAFAYAAAAAVAAVAAVVAAVVVTEAAFTPGVDYSDLLNDVITVTVSAAIDAEAATAAVNETNNLNKVFIDFIRKNND